METHPIPSFVNSSPAAANRGEASYATTRGPRPEKHVTRANIRKHKNNATEWKPVNAIAEQLFNIYSIQEIDSLIIRLLQGKDRRVGGIPQRNDTKCTLENRITKDMKVTGKKEISPAKLERIQKRCEVRAEKKKRWLKNKATPGAIETDVTSVPGPGHAPVNVVPVHEDEINFDEL
jgi:hypothetical protein